MLITIIEVFEVRTNQVLYQIWKAWKKRENSYIISYK